MPSDVVDLLDEAPDKCPGCGLADSPLGDGPSRLMCVYQPELEVVWCLNCNIIYSGWLLNSHMFDGISQYKYRPDCMVNIEKIRNGIEPKYVTDVHPGSYFGPPRPRP
jgi:hypothetical protein